MSCIEYCKNNVCLHTSNELARIMEYENFNGKQVMFVENSKKIYKIEPNKDGSCIFFKNNKCSLKDSEKSFIKFLEEENQLCNDMFMSFFIGSPEFITSLGIKFLSWQKETVYKPCTIKQLTPKDFKINKEYLYFYLILGVLDNYSYKDDFFIKKKTFRKMCKLEKKDTILSISRGVYSTNLIVLKEFVENINTIAPYLDHKHKEIVDMYINKVNSILQGLKDFNLKQYSNEQYEYYGIVYILATLMNMYKTSFKKKKVFKGLIKDFNYLQIKKWVLNETNEKYSSVFLGSEFTQKLDRYCELVYKQIQRI